MADEDRLADLIERGGDVVIHDPMPEGWAFHRLTAAERAILVKALRYKTYVAVRIRELAARANAPARP
jgi:hypothetical protein